LTKTDVTCWLVQYSTVCVYSLQCRNSCFTVLLKFQRETRIVEYLTHHYASFVWYVRAKITHSSYKLYVHKNFD